MPDGLPFSTAVNLLLTAAIAFAGWMQWRVYDRLFKHEQAVEDQRTKAWLFLRLKPNSAHGHSTALLEISNLSQVGVWLETVTVHLEVPAGAQNKAESILLENLLPPMTTRAGVDIRALVHALVQPKGGQLPATVWAEIEFWANGLWRQEKTGRYAMSVDDSHLTEVRAMM